jgi:3-oxoacyl-[acyl-carrier-protein] synthase III
MMAPVGSTRWDALYLAGIGTYLPDKVETVDEAIAVGRYTESKKKTNGYRAVRIADDMQTGPQMAVIAAREAMSMAGIVPEKYGLVMFSYLGHPGADMWSPACYVQRETLHDGPAPAVEIKQGCAGFMLALELAGGFLATRTGSQAALIAGGDAFHLPYVDRWSSHPQNVEGDGAAAVILSTKGGFARILSTCSVGDPRLTRDPDWTLAPFPNGRTLRLETSLIDLMLDSEVDLDETVERTNQGLLRSVHGALAAAGKAVEEVRYFVHQNLAETIAVHSIHRPLGLDRRATTTDWGMDIGMVGTVDVALGLHHVLANRDLNEGDIVVLECAGAGYVWTSVVLEMLEARRASH